MPLRFLVVDDEYLIGTIIRRTLELTYPGAEIRTVRSNEEAFEVLRDFAPNLITTDLYRPGGSGYDLLTALRQDPLTEFTPVVAISGAGGNEKLRQYEHGFNAVLPKPFSTDDFVGCINRLLHVRADPDTALIHLGFETPNRDYKESLDLTRKETVAAFAKDVIAMANFGGGTIVVGVREVSPGEFVPEGLSDAHAAALETSRINRAVRAYLDPPVAISTRRVRNGTRLFIVAEVPPALGTPILAARQHEGVGLYPGRIYTRTSAAESAEIRDSSELRSLLERLFAR